MASGSFINNLMDGTQNSPTVNVGDKATILLWSDRNPAIVKEVHYTAKGKLKSVVVQEIKWQVDNWQSGYAAEYFPEEFVCNPREFKVVTHGRNKGKIMGLMIGGWDAYRDPHY